MLIRLCGELIILSLIEVDRNMKHTYKKKLSVQYYDNQYKKIYTLIWKNPIREKEMYHHTYLSQAAIRQLMELTLVITCGRLYIKSGLEPM